MISILIPIYNSNAFSLVFELQKQFQKAGVVFEILCQDDASKSPLNEYNKEINLLPNCSFVSLKKNVAHRENRNLLAEKSKYNWLLFIDGDSKIISEKYSSNYVNAISLGFDVVYGGRIHPEICPSKSQMLRWKYGRFTEDKIALERKKNNFKNLLFNNTLIKKQYFNKVKFDKENTLYGHDDTQLSYQLSLLNISVLHIDNQIEHKDIDTNIEFVNKMNESILSLLRIYKSNKIPSNYVTILKLYTTLKKYKISNLIAFVFKITKPLIEKQLTSNNPSLFLFGIYRLGLICSTKA
jgi:hypothetical protein